MMHGEEEEEEHGDEKEDNDHVFNQVVLVKLVDLRGMTMKRRVMIW